MMLSIRMALSERSESSWLTDGIGGSTGMRFVSRNFRVVGQAFSLPAVSCTDDVLIPFFSPPT
jgi:hypothetical protein